MPYQLQLHCPIAWPDHPPYPIDSFTNGQASTGLPTSEAQQDVQDPPSVDKVWLRQLYLKALYGLGDLQEVSVAFVGIVGAIRTEEALQERHPLTR